MKTLWMDDPRSTICKPYRFQQTSCSQCGQNFGPGEHGFSHCDHHPGWKRDRKLARQAAARKGWQTRGCNIS